MSVQNFVLWSGSAQFHEKLDISHYTKRRGGEWKPGGRGGRGGREGRWWEEERKVEMDDGEGIEREGKGRRGMENGVLTWLFNPL